MNLDEMTLDQKCINTLRFLAVDAVQRANSGHPGLPLDAAPMAYVLWAQHLRHDPADPHWFDRDRFVLSAGHGSALAYALLHLCGYDLPLSELQSFRQWGSHTPGHPENRETPGIEVTTGPLGQGLANAVGFAIAERHLAATYNRPGHDVINHRTYVLASDGDLMEGISYEACALAGHLRLDKLTVLYDDNRVCLGGATALSSSEDVDTRFRAAGWHVLLVKDGNDLGQIDAALSQARDQESHPTLIVVRTTIGYGSPGKQNSFHAHGSPLGVEEVAATKRALGWPEAPAFLVPDEVAARGRQIAARGARHHQAWDGTVRAYRRAHPDLAAELERRMRGDLPPDWRAALPTFPPDEEGQPTRKASGAVLQQLAATVPELMGGSADLNPSTYTALKAHGDFESPDFLPDDRQGAVGGAWDYASRNLHFGVREHAMGAIANGLAQHGGIIPYTATFLVFSDYMRAPIRLAALGGYGTIFVFTHDSIGVGEDGPTHQPVEQLMSLRLIPDLVVLRPGDANEAATAWEIAVERRQGPTALVLSRQSLATLDRVDLGAAENVRKGAYTLWQSASSPDLVILASGSELALALEAARAVAALGSEVRVVSMPSWELFEAQPSAYRDEVLPPGSKRLAVEAGRSLGWERYVGREGRIIGVDGFGASAPGPVVVDRYGFNVEHLVAAARELVQP